MGTGRISIFPHPGILRGEVRGCEGGGVAVVPRVMFDDVRRLFLVVYQRR